MKSTIKIDFIGLDGSKSEQFQPVIRVHLEDTDDARDGLLQAFFNQLGYLREDGGPVSHWLVVDVQSTGGNR